MTITTTSPNGKIITYSMKDVARKPPVPHIASPDAPAWDYTVYENRLSTFSEGWAVEFITPQQMASAGFYYMGTRDKVRCLYCSKELDTWEPTDDPVEEHKRISPQCAFFRESRGKLL